LVYGFKRKRKKVLRMGETTTRETGIGGGIQNIIGQVGTTWSKLLKTILQRGNNGQIKNGLSFLLKETQH